MADLPVKDRLAAQLEDHGFCIVPNVLSAADLARARNALDRGIALTRQQLGSTHIPTLDPNPSSIRVNNLPAMDAVFRELLLRSDALTAVELTIGPHFLISNFTAHVAMPGSDSMKLHSDQALVVPEPWLRPWAMNIIWCLDDVHAGNGATCYLPGSHRFHTADEVPADALSQTVAFEASAGSFIAMDGRLWHTSGANRSGQDRRRMLFAYYSADFLRQQINWTLTLPADLQAALDRRSRALFGLSPLGNTRLALELTTLPGTS